MNTIKVAVIGLGNIGTMHADNIYENKIQGMQLVGICDINQARLDTCQARFSGMCGYSDYMELLESNTIDAVIIAVPHPLHAKIAIEALERDIHVLLEKPIDVTVAEAQKLVEVSKRTDKVFAIMFNQRTNPLFQKAREIVQGGLLGELKRTVWIVTNWYRTQHYYDSGEWRATWCGEGGGVLLNQAPHNLDLWQWICGMPQTVRAFCNVAKYHNIEVEDDATIFTTYENGAAGVFITTTGEYPGTNRLEISGDKGKLVLEQGLLKWWRLEESEREICYRSMESFPEIACEYKEFIDDDNGDGHKKILQNFANAILCNETLLSPGEEGIYELTISNAAYLSEWSGNTEITLPFDVQRFQMLLEERQATGCIKTKDNQATENVEHSLPRWQVRW